MPDNDPAELTMEAFRPVTDRKRGPKAEAGERPRRLPYAGQNPAAATHVEVTTPDGRYESGSFEIDENRGEITVDAQGTRILLDRRNVVVYLDAESPSVYPRTRCGVSFTASGGGESSGHGPAAAGPSR